MNILMIILPLFAFLSGYVEASKWTNPFVLGTESYNHNLAIDPKGNATAVWTQKEGDSSVVQVGTLPNSGTWSITDLSPAGVVADNANIIIDRKGNAIAVWSAETGIPRDGDTPLVVIQAATLAQGSTQWVYASENLSSPSLLYSGPFVKVDKDGNALAVWGSYTEDGTYLLQSARLPFGTNSWIQLNDYGNNDFIGTISVDMDIKGNAVAVWESDDPSHPFVINASTLMKNSNTWSTHQKISSGKIAWNPQVVVDKRGNAIAVWNEWGSTLGGARLSFQSSDWVSLKNFGQNALQFNLAIDGNGNAYIVLVWSKSNLIQFATLTQGEVAWSIPFNLTVPGQTVSHPNIAVDRAGNSFVVWINRDKGILQAKTIPFGKNPSSAFTLTTIENGFNFGKDPFLALSANGTAVVVYPNDDSSSPTVIKAISSKDIFSLIKK